MLVTSAHLLVALVAATKVSALPSNMADVDLAKRACCDQYEIIGSCTCCSGSGATQYNYNFGSLGVGQCCGVIGNCNGNTCSC
ncbi:hypothetical protein F4779DRAFT_619074 [Xylariaceae sp. FL0662B]|nr:hypothetical protein F4779DRAFT_619074 [Xylariaceae sp. FL0662B]